MALPTQTSVFRLLIVSVALLGALVVTHLQLQASNDFVNGCSGIANAELTYDPTAPAEAESGCETVTSSAYAKTFGVSQIVWGFLFYGLLVGLRLAYAATTDDRLRLASFALSAVGVLYAVYLVVVQATQIGAFCALCLTSSTIVLILFVLHFLEHRRLRASSAPRRGAAPERRGLAALRPYAPILGVFVLLLLVDVAVAGRSDAQAPQQAAQFPPSTEPTPGANPLTAATENGATPAGSCEFDSQIAPISDVGLFTTGPFKGSDADDAVTVVEIFDPNCPHCRDLSEAMAPVVEAESARARFYYVPYPLRQQSIAQVIALKVAQREGKFFELMDEMFRRQDQTWGMSLPELVSTLDAVGMDGTAFQTMLQDEAQLQPLLTQVQTEAAAVSAAFATADGGISVPKIAVGNRVVAATTASYSPDCFSQFISETAAQ